VSHDAQCLFRLSVSLGFEGLLMLLGVLDAVVETAGAPGVDRDKGLIPDT
jgi:hypothetical protein